MHRTIISAFFVSALLAGTSSSRAADLSEWAWSGSYVGGHVGLSSFETGFRSDFGLVAPGAYRETARSGGIHVGHGRMVGPFYLGIEGSFTAYGDAEARGRGLDRSTVTFGTPGCGSEDCGTIFTSKAEGFETDLRSVSALRARLGYPVGRLLPYVSAGASAGDMETRYAALTYTQRTFETGVFEFRLDGQEVDDRFFAFGYTVGAGLDLAVSQRVSIRTEYLFTDLGRRVYSVPDGSASESFDTRLHEGRIGLSVRF
jgi:outer membrane immunogenic protein